MHTIKRTFIKTRARAVLLAALLLTLLPAWPTSAQTAAGPKDFATPTTYQTSALSENTDYGSVDAIVDLNGDGLLDLVVGNFDAGTVSVVPGKRDSSASFFGIPTTTRLSTLSSERVLDTAVGNIVDGGGLEIVALSVIGIGSTTSTIRVLGNNGSGTYMVLTGLARTQSGDELAAADFNADGRLDLALGYDGGISILLGNGNGFGDPTSYALGSNGSGVTAATASVIATDLTGDARPDLVVLQSQNTNRIGWPYQYLSVLHNNGSGGFSLVQSKAAPDNAGIFGSGELVADFNRDGRVDIIIDDVLLTGQAGGTFSDPTALAAPLPGFREIAVDYDRDGKLDIVSVGDDTDLWTRLRLIRGNGDGSFQQPLEFPNAAGPGGFLPRSLGQADLNGDSFPDFIVALGQRAQSGVLGATFAINVFLGSTNPSYPPIRSATTGANPPALVTADFTADGAPDLATVNLTDKTISLLAGVGDGNFEAHVDFPIAGPNPIEAATGDFNRDSRPDLAVVHRDPHGTVTIMLRDGSGFAPIASQQQFAVGNDPRAVVAGDLNGDGKIDLATPNFAGNNLSVLLGNGDGTFATKVDYTTGTNPQALAIADVNQDGKADLIAANNGAANISVLLGTGNGTFGAKTDFSVGAGPRAVTAADLDDDGDQDLATANFDANTVSVLRGAGNGTFGTRADYVTSRGPRVVLATDLNKDGKLDLAVANSNSSDVSVLRGAGGGAFVPAASYPSGGYTPRGMVQVDLNCNGYPDLATANIGSSLVGVLMNANGPAGPGCDTDSLPPSSTITLSPASPNGSNGWYTSGVQVTVTTSDGAGSGVAETRCVLDPTSVPASFDSIPVGCAATGTGVIITSDGQHTLYAASRDRNGNKETPKSSTFKLDTTMPTITASGTTADGLPYTPGTWTNQTVTVHFTCADATSGVASCPTDQVISRDGTFTAVGTARDAAGNSASVSFGPIQIDTTAPLISGNRTPAANANGWNNSPVSVSFSCVDTLSGIANNTVAGAVVSAEGANQSVTSSGACVDNAGNVADHVTVGSIKIDMTKPTISASATSAPNAAGWYKASVTVRFSCADALSGLDGACPADQTLSAEGAAVASTAATVSDLAGNTSAPSNIVTVKIDRTNPTLAPVVSPNPVQLGGTASVSSGAADALSGIASQSCDPLHTSIVGVRSVTCTATDTAGNTSSATVTYSVIYSWGGFFQPVDNLPTINSIKAGQSIPVKFSLGGDQGLSIFAAGYPTSQQIACSSGVPVDAIEQTVTAGESSLSYDAATGQYTYVWKTEKSWAGTCRQLTLRLVDGTNHQANFAFTR